MSRKNYSRKQIVNSIKYWLNELATMFLHEALTKTVSDFELKFTHDVVFSRKRDFVFTQSSINDAFDILNNNIFKGQLELIPIVFLTHHQMQEMASESNIRNAYASYVRIIQPIHHNSRRFSGEIVSGSQKIFITNDVMNTFAFSVGCLCHEMIHYWIDQNTTIVDRFVEVAFRGLKFNSHDTQFFENFIKKSKQEGICVMKDTENYSDDQLNDIFWTSISLADDKEKNIREANEFETCDDKQLDNMAKNLCNMPGFAAYAKGDKIMLMSFI